MSTSTRPLRDADGNIIDRNLVYAKGATVSVTSSSASASSTSAFASGTGFVEVLASALSYITMGSSTASAATSNTPVPANVPTLMPTNGNRYFAVIASTLAGSTSGKVHATELT